MPRSPRIEYPGAIYHITSRGNRKENIYLSDNDKYNFLMLLGKTCGRCDWICHAYCLMNNHYHLLLETPFGNLAKGMQHLNGVYTQQFNKKYNHVGHVFQGRYKSILVEKDSYLLELARYIVLNPVRANLVSNASEWKWSSYSATCGEITAPSWLTVNWIQDLFKSHHGVSLSKYKQFIHEGLIVDSPWKHLKKQVYLGSDSFVREISKNNDFIHVPKLNSYNLTKSLTEIEDKTQNRNHAILIAYETGNFTLKNLADYFDLHYSRISKIIKQENERQRASA
jgi:REP element-mobilizing transposase RayT